MRTIVSVSVESRLASDFDMMCAEEKITKSELISSWIDAFVQKHNETPDMNLCPKCGAKYARKLNFCPSCAITDAKTEQLERKIKQHLSEEQKEVEIEQLFQEKIREDEKLKDEYTLFVGTEQYTGWKEAVKTELRKKYGADKK